VFLYSNLEDKRFCIEWQQTFPDFNLLLIYPSDINTSHPFPKRHKVYLYQRK
jgi:hypothetical protein